MGRGRELEVLRARVDAARGGRGGMVLVSGPPGIGKSYLVAAAVAGVPGVLRGRCLPGGNAPLLWPWLRAAGRFFSDPPAIAIPPAAEDFESAAARFRMLANMCDELVRAASNVGGLVVVVEDLHDAEEVSLDLLRHIADVVGDSFLLIIGTHRDTADLGDAGLGATLAEVTRNPAVQTIPLSPLRTTDIAGYLVAGGFDPTLAGTLHERCGGVPLLMNMMTNAMMRDQQQDGWGDPVLVLPPGDLQVLIAGLFSGVDEAARATAVTAAVLDEDLDPVLLAEVLKLSISLVQDQLTTLRAAGVIRPTDAAPGTYRFVHQLVRDGITASGVDAAADCHRRAALSLEKRLGTDPRHAARIGLHWARAGDDPVALRSTVQWARTAARYAMAMLAGPEATRLLDLALDALDRASPAPRERAELLIELADAERMAGRIATAIDHLRLASANADPRHDADLLTSAALVIRRAPDQHSLIAAIALCDSAVTALDLAATVGENESAATVTARARVIARKARLDSEADLLDDPESATTGALALAERCGDHEAMFDAMLARVQALDQPQHLDERLRLAAIAIKIGREARHTLAEVRGRVWRIDAAYQAGDIAGVDREIAWLADLGAAGDQPAARWFALRTAAGRTALSGRFDDALSQSESAGTLAAGMSDPGARAVTDQFAGLLAIIRGEPPQTPRQLPPSSNSMRPRGLLAAHALWLQHLGRTQEALAIYEHLRLQLRGPTRGIPGLAVLQYLTELVEAFDDAEAAEWAHDQWLPWAQTSGLPGSALYFCGGAPARGLGRMAAVQGHLDEAEAALRAAVTRNTQLDAQAILGHTWLDLADVLRRVGSRSRRAEAIAFAARAEAQARRLDQPGPLRRARQLLDDLAARRHDNNPLTTRERQVAELVMRALPNRKIAEQLFLSERTVETHVHNILTKLSLTNRNELIAELARSQPQIPDRLGRAESADPPMDP